MAFPHKKSNSTVASGTSLKPMEIQEARVILVHGEVQAE